MRQAALTLLAALCGALICCSDAQRPTYAGARPGGLSQKDKYLPTATFGSPTGTMNATATATANGTVFVANRFGAQPDPAVNTIPYGGAQQPPAQGLPVVLPETSYHYLPPPPPSAAPAPNATDVQTRFGAPTATTTTTTNGTVPQPLPLDAHGDRVLLDQLAQLPVDKRPFWYLNYLAIEAHRNGTAAAGGFGVPAGRPGSFASSWSG